jgi:hypothetical protein
VKVELGIAREVARDANRRTRAQERRQEIEVQKQALRGGVEAAAKSVAEAEERAAKVDARVKELTEVDEKVAAADMERAAREADELLEAAKAELQPVQQLVNDVDFGKGCSDDHESLLGPERERLLARLNRLNAQLCRAVVRNASFHKRASNKQKLEAEQLHAKILEVLRSRLTACGRRHPELFSAIDTNKDGFVGQDEFVSFLEAHWDKTVFPRDAVVRWFGQLNGDSTEKIEARDLERLVRVCYKVVNPVAMNDKLNASDSETSAVRRLQVDDVLELCGDGAEEDTATGVMRIHARCLSGGSEVGYVTVKSNQGTVFIETGGALFIVIEETSLRDSSGSQSNSEASRKLKKGEILEVLEFPRKDEASGATMTKVKAQSDGAVGWTTSLSSQGQAFLKVV